MSNLAIGYKTLVDNGKEHRSDGLLKHLGMLDTSTLRVCGMGGIPALTGAGVETYYNTAGNPGYGVIQCYDRDAQTYRDLAINARSITISTQQGGKVSLPAGSIQAHVVNYMGAPTWSSAQSGVWLETPVGGTATFSGVECRIEATLNWTNNTLNSWTQFGWGLDNVVQAAVARAHTPNTSFLLSSTFILYAVIPAGTHKVGVWLNNNTGVTSLDAGTYQNFHVMEQRA